MLQPQTLQFLRQLKKHNDRSWFEANRKNYEAAKQDFLQLVTAIIKQLATIDSDVVQLNAKDCLFRINRDIRFSKDKSPYKTNFGASFSKGGKKSIFAGYYLHVEPDGESFVGGGLWMPEAKEIKQVRQEIDYCWEEFENLVKSKPFTKQYKDLERSKEFILSREPKGFSKDNPAIEYIKLKSWVATAALSDQQLTDKNLLKEIITAFTILQPLIKFINRSMQEQH